MMDMGKQCIFMWAGVGYIIKLIDGKKNTFVFGGDQAKDKQAIGREDALGGAEEQDET
jgi:hypothetical protein